MAAVRQFHAREGHLRPARKHIEAVDGEPFKLGAFLENTRRRAANSAPNDAHNSPASDSTGGAEA